jgi:hypothetical protein
VNLLSGSLGVFVPGHFTIPPQPAGIGDFVPGSFTLPQNPVTLGMGDIHGGMGCLSCGTYLDRGMGDLGDLTATWSQITSYQVGGVPIVYLAIGGLVLYYVVSGATGTRGAKREARQRYKQAVVDAQSKYGIVGRTRRAISAFGT